MPRDDATVLDILMAACEAVEFKGDIDKRAFLNDRKTQASILHRLLIIGEAAKRLSEEFRITHSDIEWKSIAGMRDKLIHHYHDVDFEEVWRVVETDIPDLITRIEPLAPREEEE